MFYISSIVFLSCCYFLSVCRRLYILSPAYRNEAQSKSVAQRSVVCRIHSTAYASMLLSYARLSEYDLRLGMSGHYLPINNRIVSVQF